MGCSPPSSAATWRRVEALYADDVVVWHSVMPRPMDKARSLAILDWLMAPASRAQYEIHEQLVDGDRLAQRHTLRVTIPGHDAIEMPVSLFITITTAASPPSTSTSTARPPTSSSSSSPAAPSPDPNREVDRLVKRAPSAPIVIASPAHLGAGPFQGDPCRSPSPKTTAPSPTPRRTSCTKRDARGAARALLEADDRGAARRSGATSSTLGWLGLHVPEEHGGSGYGLEELVVVVEELGRAVAPGPVRADGDRQRRARRGRPTTPPRRSYLPGLADGSTHRRGRPRRRRSTVSDGKASGDAGAVLGGGLADVLLVPAGDDVAVVEVRRRRRRSTTPAEPRPDPPLGAGHPRRRRRRRCCPAPARRCVDLRPHDPRPPRRSASPASAPSWPPPTPRSAMQFGRPIAMYQAVKHHCANMFVATELATSAVWDAARAADGGGDQLSLRRGRSPPRSPARPPTCAPTSTPRCTAASASPGSTTPTSTCAGPPRCWRCSTPSQAAADLDRPHPRGRASATKDGRAAARGRADPRRGAGVRRRDQGPRRRRAARPS